MSYFTGEIDETPEEEFVYAIGYGNIEEVKLLLAGNLVDPSFGENWPILWASGYGHVELVEFLLTDERVDPSALDNKPIQWASVAGHIKVVKVLLLHLLDKAPNKYITKWAECIAEDPQALYDRCKEVNDADRYSIVFVRLKQALSKDDTRLQKIIELERRVDEEITRPALQQEWLNE